MSHTTAYRATVIHCLDDPGANSSQMETFDDGLLVVEDGKIIALGDTATLEATLATNTQMVDYRGKLICPGFIDTHVHYPQTEVIASFGTRLLDWLEQYTYPTENKFKDNLYNY